MYAESEELKALTARLKTSRLDRRDAQCFETVDWYIKVIMSKNHENLKESEKEFKVMVSNLLNTWNDARNS